MPEGEPAFPVPVVLSGVPVLLPIVPVVPLGLAEVPGSVVVVPGVVVPVAPVVPLASGAVLVVPADAPVPVVSGLRAHRARACAGSNRT